MPSSEQIKSIESLIEHATEARANAYAPYSGFLVGAAVLTKSGAVFTGANVENVSLGLTLCAERVAMASAVAHGQKDLEAVVIVTDTPEPTVPCGACCQFLAEFEPDVMVLLATTSGKRRQLRLRELLREPCAGILNVPRRT